MEEAPKEIQEVKKRTTLAYKIDPPIGYLPTADGLIDKPKIKQLRADLRSQDVKKIQQARDTIIGLKLGEAYETAKKSGQTERIEAVENVRLRLEYAVCKALYQLGDYK